MTNKKYLTEEEVIKLIKINKDQDLKYKKIYTIIDIILILILAICLIIK